jgi:hypothetical protein
MPPSWGQSGWLGSSQASAIYSNPGETDMILRNIVTGGLEVYDIANNQIIGATARRIAHPKRRVLLRFWQRNFEGFFHTPWISPASGAQRALTMGTCCSVYASNYPKAQITQGGVA